MTSEMSVGVGPLPLGEDDPPRIVDPNALDGDRSDGLWGGQLTAGDSNDPTPDPVGGWRCSIQVTALHK